MNKNRGGNKRHDSNHEKKPVENAVASKDVDKLKRHLEKMAQLSKDVPSEQKKASSGAEKSEPVNSYNNRDRQKDKNSNNSRGHNVNQRQRGPAVKGLHAGSSMDKPEEVKAKVENVQKTDKSEEKPPPQSGKGRRSSSESEKANSLFSGPPFPPPFIPGGGDNVNWLQMQLALAAGLPGPAYPMNGKQKNGGMGILGDPLLQSPADMPKKPEPYGAKPKIEKPNHVNVPPKKPSTSIGPDKSEREKSLDFIKNYFNKDPETQSNRQKSQGVPRAAPVMGIAMQKQMKKNPGGIIPTPKQMNSQYLNQQPASTPTNPPHTPTDSTPTRQPIQEGPSSPHPPNQLGELMPQMESDMRSLSTLTPDADPFLMPPQNNKYSNYPMGFPTFPVGPDFMQNPNFQSGLNKSPVQPPKFPPAGSFSGFNNSSVGGGYNNDISGAYGGFERLSEPAVGAFGGGMKNGAIGDPRGHQNVDPSHWQKTALTKCGPIDSVQENVEPQMNAMEYRDIELLFHLLDNRQRVSAT